MAYTKTVWTDRQVTNPLRFTLNNISTNVYDLIPTEGSVVQAGTAINATNMNNIENGIFNLDATVTTNTTNITNLQSGKVNKAGDTMTGDLTVPNLVASGTVSEGGQLLSARYLALTGGTLTGTLQTAIPATGVASLLLKNTSDDGQIRVLTSPTLNQVQSGNSAFSASKAYRVSGINGTALPTFEVVATTATITGNASVTGTLSVTGNTTLTGTLSSGVITESGTLLSAKYMQLNADNNMTGQLTVNRNGFNILVKGTAVGNASTSFMQVVDSAGTAQGQFGKTATGTGDIVVRALTGDLEITTNTGLVKVTDDLLVTGLIKVSDGTNATNLVTTQVGDGTGIGVALQSGGKMVVGSGESAVTTMNDASTSTGNTEQMYVTSDQDVRVWSNVQAGVASKHELKYDATGKLTSDGDLVYEPTPTWTNITLQNGATANGTRTPRYRKANGVVYLQGEITSIANGTVIATLPAGYRPNNGSGINFLCAIANGGTAQFAMIGVGSTGAVTMFVTSGGASPICLNNIQFPADQ